MIGWVGLSAAAGAYDAFAILTRRETLSAVARRYRVVTGVALLAALWHLFPEES